MTSVFLWAPFLPTLLLTPAQASPTAPTAVLQLAEQANQQVKMLPAACKAPSFAGPTAATPKPEAKPPSSETRSPALGGLSIGKSLTLSNGQPAVQVNGCKQDAAIRFGYESDRQCGAVAMNTKLAQHINKNLLTCAIQSAQAAGLPTPVRLFVNHMGCYNNRNIKGTNRLSLHAHARAWDIGAINLVDAQGRSTKVSMNKNAYGGKNAVFYDQFRECWKRSLPCGKGSVGHTGSKLGGNADHNDHLHLEYPACAG